MPTPSRPPSRWTPRRRRGAALQLILGGLLLMGVPVLLGESALAAGLRALAPIAWLMAVAGAVVLLVVRDTQAPSGKGGAVPLHPQRVRPRRAEGRPLARPPSDPLDLFMDTESPSGGR